MTCEICNGQEATVHLTQVVDGDVKKLHLCEACALKSGINIENPVSISELLLGLGKVEPADSETAPPRADRVCPVCHLSQSDFRKTGRLGCPACYDAFAADLAPLLRQMHRRARHVGRTPRGGTHPPAQAAELASVREALDRAVAEERFEDAARHRDRLAELRVAGSSPDIGEPRP